MRGFWWGLGSSLGRGLGSLLWLVALGGGVWVLLGHLPAGWLGETVRRVMSVR